MTAMWGVRGRRRSGAAAVTAVVAAMVLVPVPSADAAPLGGFEIDGNLSADGSGSIDWVSLGGSACVIDGVNDATGYKGSETDPVSTWERDSVPNGKTDIVAIQTHSLVDAGSGHQWTYVGIQRATTDGSTYFSYEYNQQPNVLSTPRNGPRASVPDRTTGDLLLQFEQQGNGQNEELGKIVVTAMDRWLDGRWVSQTIVPSAISGRSNSAASAGLCGQAQAVPGAFMEVALDLTALGMEPGCVSDGFGTFNVRSRQSPAPTSEMSDVATGSVDIQPNCGSATITKRGPSGAVVGDTGLRFEIEPDPRDGTGSAFVNDNVTANLAGNEVADRDDRLGHVSFSTSIFGEYTVTEVAPPAGYLLPGDTATTVAIGRYSDVPIEIVDPLGTGTVLKVDATTGSALGGAEFSFTKTDAPYQGTVVTVRDDGAADLDPRAGHITAGGLFTGEWEVRETEAPVGYRLEDATRTLTVSSATPNPSARTAFENHQNGQLAWAKVGEDEQTRLAGAQFRLDRLVGGQVVETISVVDNSGRDTDADTGEFQVSGLAFGQWRVTETQAPSGYQGAPAQAFTVDSTDHTVTFSFVNTENGQATWRKVNEFGDVLEGAGFTLRLGGQSLVVTDNTGVPGYSGLDTSPEPGYFAVGGLDFGAWTLSETTVPRGYAGGDAETFTVTAQTPLVDLGDIVNTQDGQVRWTKVDEEATSLAGAEFTLALDNRQEITVVDNTGDAGYQGRDTDTRTGHFAVRGLDFGTWSLTESVAPLGYTGSADSLDFTVSATEQTVDLGEVVNEMNGRLAWSKVDEDGAPLGGATFTLTRDGRTVNLPDFTGQDDYEGEDTNPAVGVFAVAGLDFGEWTLTETVVPQGYAGIAPRRVDVVPAHEPLLLGPIENEENGRASWSKTDGEGEPLGGAVFELTMDGEVVEVPDNTGQHGYDGPDTDAAAGEFAVDRLDFGVWTLVETSAPGGYVLDETPREVEVSASGEPVDAGVFINVEGWATLAADKTAYEFGPDGTLVESDGVVAFGDTVVYGIEVAADGTVPQSDVVVTDTLEDGITYEADSAGCDPEGCPVGYDAQTRTLTWSVADLEAGQVVTVYFVATLAVAPLLAPGEDAMLAVDNVALAASDVVPEAWSDTVRVVASASEPPAQGVAPPTTAKPTLPARPVTQPSGPSKAQSSLAHTGLDGLPQLTGAAALMLALGAGMWRVATRREH